MRILTFCGSLRAQSSNRAMLRAYAHVAPANFTFEHYERLGQLPHFNPDADNETPPDEVRELRRLVAGADAVVISTPEYAHALPGSFKNALDWLVSDPAFMGKPVVILHAPRGSTWALDSLKEVLAAMSARILERASVTLPLGSNRIGTDAIVARDDFRQLLVGSTKVLLNEIAGTSDSPS